MKNSCLLEMKDKYLSKKNPGISRDIPNFRVKNPGIFYPGIISIYLSQDQKIPGWILSENPGSKANRKSRDFGIPTLDTNSKSIALSMAKGNVH